MTNLGSIAKQKGWNVSEKMLNRMSRYNFNPSPEQLAELEATGEIRFSQEQIAEMDRINMVGRREELTDEANKAWQMVKDWIATDPDSNWDDPWFVHTMKYIDSKRLENVRIHDMITQLKN